MKNANKPWNNMKHYIIMFLTIPVLYKMCIRDSVCPFRLLFFFFSGECPCAVCFAIFTPSIRAENRTWFFFDERTCPLSCFKRAG